MVTGQRVAYLGLTAMLALVTLLWGGLVLARVPVPMDLIGCQHLLLGAFVAATAAKTTGAVK